MDVPPAGSHSQRQKRAATAITLALIVIAGASVAYLASSQTSTPQSASQAGNRLIVTLDAVSYDFISPTLGWALKLANGPTESGTPFEVFRTVDGARHWQRQFVGQSRVSGLAQFAVKSFDATHAFMTIGRPIDHLYRTTDGGAHWIAVPLLSLTIEAIWFSDSRTGWLSGGFSSSTGMEPRLFATHDAGDSWTRLPDPPSGGLVLRRSSDAWLGSFGGAPPHVYFSDDGAISWRLRQIPYPPTLDPSASWPISQWDAAIGLLPGVGAIARVTCVCAPTSAFTFSSFDAGMTWKFVPPTLGSVGYESDLDWWVIDNRTLYKSHDAGQTWTKISDQLPEWNYSPHVLDSKHAWAMLSGVGGWGLALTSDGGIHWTRASVPQTS